MAFSYNISPYLLKLLKQIDLARKNILLTPISPRDEIQLTYEKTVDEIYWSLKMSNNPLTRGDTERLLASPQKKRLGRAEREVIDYKRSIDYIRHNWFVTSNTVTPKTIYRLYELSYLPTTQRPTKSFAKADEEELKRVLDYLQTGSESPVVQAGIAQIQIIDILPFGGGNGRVARLLSELFLYKNGLDFRRLLAISEYFMRDAVTLQQVTKTTLKRENLTLWLEYYTHAIATQLSRAIKDIDQLRFKSDLPESFWDLNDRQKSILTLLDKPGERISNKKVQDRYKVSQITASRDLSKLSNLNLIFSHGKGRSIYYTKV